MNAFTNPTAIRIIFVVGSVIFLACAAALPYAVVRFRRSLTDSGRLDETPSGTLLSPDSFAFATFQQTIRDLKEREKELQAKFRVEKERADAASALTRSLLESIPLPSIALNSVGIVQYASPSAKKLFGRESLVGFNLANLFGDAVIESRTIDAIETPAIPVSELVRDALRGKKLIPGLRVECTLQAETHSILDVTILPDKDGAGIVLIANVVVPCKGACTDEVPSVAESPCSTGTEES